MNSPFSYRFLLYWPGVGPLSPFGLLPFSSIVVCLGGFDEDVWGCSGVAGVVVLTIGLFTITSSVGVWIASVP